VGTTAGAGRQPQPGLRRLDEAAPELLRHLQAGSAALLFGSEKRGLSNQDFSHCHWLIRIPTRTEHPSMNLGQAVAVCLYELVREVQAPVTAAAVKLASAGETERLTAALLEVLRASGYVKPRATASAEEKVRRLVRRLNPEAGDAQLVLGMLRQILWKLNA
jgi:tRNA/rRNA methyltransferase